jgi:tetratricopeptide (TPR) repeat protein
MVALGKGDLPGARSVIAAVPHTVDPAALVALFGNIWDLYWVLDETQQQLLLRLRPSDYGDDRATWGLVLAETYALRGDQPRAQIYADSARIAFEQILRAAPTDAQRSLLGLALAYLGRKTEAVREGRRAMELSPIARDAFFGPYLQHQLARIYLLVGEPEKALDELESILKKPYYLSPGWLRIDPNFAPLRGNPRFERLVRGTQ